MMVRRHAGCIFSFIIELFLIFQMIFFMNMTLQNYVMCMNIGIDFSKKMSQTGRSVVFICM